MTDRPTPKQAAAIKWWNQLTQNERNNLSAEYGVGLANVTQAYEEWSVKLASARNDLEKILGGKY